MKYYIGLCLLLISAACVAATPSSFSCSLDNWNQSQLNQFKQSDFSTFSSKHQDVNVFALELTDCLGSKNPVVRDELTYSAYFHWLRNNTLKSETVLTLFEQLSKDIETGRNDEHAVFLPFAVLVYAELMRVDRNTPYLTDKQLDYSVNLAANTLKTTTDFRGFENEIGWRHLVAHSADLILQLVLNKRLSKQQHDVLLDSLFSQVSPKQHSYVFGESKRLALPILYSWMADKHSLDEWQIRIDHLLDPSPFANWADVFSSEAGLHKQHNTRLFLLELYRSVSVNDAARLNKLEPSLKQALRQFR